MLSKLASHAEAGKIHTRPMADGALREQVDRLLEGWTLEDPSPEAYSRSLQRLAISGGADEIRDDDEARLRTKRTRCASCRSASKSAGTGPLVERAIDQAIDDGAIEVLPLLLCPHRPRTARARRR